MAKYSSKKTGSKKKKSVTTGVIHIYASFNNTIITISDLQGNVISWSSAGKHGFKGSRKATPYAAQVATGAAVDLAVKNHGLNTVSINVTGPGVGREAALRAIQAAGLNATVITDRTYHPHNGCRPAKRRRV